MIFPFYSSVPSHTHTHTHTHKEGPLCRLQKKIDANVDGVEKIIAVAAAGANAMNKTISVQAVMGGGGVRWGSSVCVLYTYVGGAVLGVRVQCDLMSSVSEEV
jgi:hypothetical protein